MAQLVTRLDEDLLAGVDDLVEAGVVSSRSEAVREALRTWLDHIRRSRVADAIVAGYQAVPQNEEEASWSDAATRTMIADEPW
jgi:Arc/MetJ-type ribon-helix-helix transcriptional regulator